MSIPPEEHRFRANVLNLCDLIHELTGICWEEGFREVNPALIPLGKTYLANIDQVQLIETFITYSWEHWGKIRSRDEIFFIENASDIFAHLPVEKGKIGAFKMLFTAKDSSGTDIIPDEDRDAIWDMFESLVKICIKYVHRIRECVLKEIDGKMKPRYLHNKFPRIKVKSLSKEWDIELNIPKA